MRRGLLALACGLLLALAAGCGGAAKPAGAVTDEGFLKQHGWTVAAKVAAHTVKLPDRFAVEPGAFPVGVYWAYNNELSKDVGLDFRPYAGKTVTATLYRLNETLPDKQPNKEMRAVILRHGGQLVGAYLDRMGHFGFAGSLKGRTFAQVVGKEFGQWAEAAQVVDYGHPVYRELAPVTPEELIRAFWEAIDRHEYNRAYAMLSLSARLGSLFANRRRDALYNPDYAYNFGGLENMRSATGLKLSGYQEIAVTDWTDPETNRRVHRGLQFGASVNVTFDRVIARESGPNHYFIAVVKETESAPWLLDAFNSGP